MPATLRLDTPVYVSGDTVYTGSDHPPDATLIRPGLYQFLRDMDGKGGWITVHRRGGTMPNTYLSIDEGKLLTIVAKHRDITDSYDFALLPPRPKPAVSVGKSSGKSEDKGSVKRGPGVKRKTGGFNPFANFKPSVA